MGGEGSIYSFENRYSQLGMLLMGVIYLRRLVYSQKSKALRVVKRGQTWLIFSECLVIPDYFSSASFSLSNAASNCPIMLDMPFLFNCFPLFSWIFWSRSLISQKQVVSAFFWLLNELKFDKLQVFQSCPKVKIVFADSRCNSTLMLLSFCFLSSPKEISSKILLKFIILGQNQIFSSTTRRLDKQYSLYSGKAFTILLLFYFHSGCYSTSIGFFSYCASSTKNQFFYSYRTTYLSYISMNAYDLCCS